jgi:hypothetical protein
MIRKRRRVYQVSNDNEQVNGTPQAPEAPKYSLEERIASALKIESMSIDIPNDWNDMQSGFKKVQLNEVSDEELLILMQHLWTNPVIRHAIVWICGRNILKSRYPHLASELPDSNLTS